MQILELYRCCTTCDDLSEAIATKGRMKAAIKQNTTIARMVMNDIEYAHPKEAKSFSWVVQFQHDSPYAVY